MKCVHSHTLINSLINNNNNSFIDNMHHVCLYVEFSLNSYVYIYTYMHRKRLFSEMCLVPHIQNQNEYLTATGTVVSRYFFLLPSHLSI